MRKIYTEKLEQIKEILKEKNIDLWILMGRETMDISDPALKFVLPIDIMGVSAFFFTPDGKKIALVRNQDVGGVEETKVFTEVHGYGSNFDEMLKNTIIKIDPKNIDINCDIYDALTDGLTAGLFLRLQNALRKTVYFERIQYGQAIRYIRGRKIQQEINVMTLCLKQLNLACQKLNNIIKVGMTEGQVYEFCQKFMNEHGLTSSWDNNCCPLVHSGKRANHAMVRPENNDIRKGDVFHLSFGAKLDGYATDFQRSWYVLDDGESKAPEEVQKAFDTIIGTIEYVRKNLRAGMMGKEIDALARKVMGEAGYTYSRGCGHTVGMALHDGVVTLGPDNSTLGELPSRIIEKDYVFTLELFAETSYGVVAVEEMVKAGENGGEFLYIPQTELWYIK